MSSIKKKTRYQKNEYQIQLKRIVLSYFDSWIVCEYVVIDTGASWSICIFFAVVDNASFSLNTRLIHILTTLFMHRKISVYWEIKKKFTRIKTARDFFLLWNVVHCDSKQMPCDALHEEDTQTHTHNRTKKQAIDCVCFVDCVRLWTELQYLCRNNCTEHREIDTENEML